MWSYCRLRTISRAEDSLGVPQVDVVYTGKDCVAVVDPTDNDSVH